MRIGIDLMGSDSSPTIFFEAVLAVARSVEFPTCFVLIATRSSAELLRRQYASLRSSIESSGLARVEFRSVSDVVEMGDEPASVVARKRASSLLVGIRLLRRGDLDGLVSAGNTGALVTAASLHLPKLPGIQRPALLAMLPSSLGAVALLDVGGSVSCKTHHLVQFAFMGAAFQQSVYGIERPVVALLNVGAESMKGTPAVKEAYRVLMKDAAERQDFHFVGNLEGQQLFQGGVDVVVADGFTGNAVLKTCEGVSAFLFDRLSQSLPQDAAMQLGRTLDKLKASFSQAEHPGAVLCGMECVVVKCHGNASPQAICSSIKGAMTLVQRQIIPKIKTRLEQLC